MVMHIWKKLLKSHLHLHPTFLAFYSDLNSCLWHCPNLAVFLTFSILFGLWLSSLISSQLTLCSVFLLSSGTVIVLLLVPRSFFRPVISWLSSQASLSAPAMFETNLYAWNSLDTFSLGHIFSQFLPPSSQPSPLLTILKTVASMQPYILFCVGIF